jgi:transposase
VHLVTDGAGLPLHVMVTAGQVHESTQFERLMEGAHVPATSASRRCRPKRVAGDKGYSVHHVRGWLRRRRIKAVIPRPSNQRPGPFDARTYRRRNVIERCVGWLKESRRIATRFEKLALNYLAMLKLELIRRYLKVAFANSA